MKKLIVFSAFVLLTAVNLNSCGGGGGGSAPPFSQADLVGTWYVNILQTGPSTTLGEPGWIRGMATISSSGTISIPSIETNLGTTFGPQNVVWTIDPWSGVISESTGSANPSFHGKLASNKQLIVGTATNQNALGGTAEVMQLRVIQKIDSSATYTVSDIADKTFMVHQIESGSGTDWMYSAGSTSAVVSETTTTVTLSTPVTKPSGTFPGSSQGKLSIDASGLVSLDTNTWFKGMLSQDKTYMIATETSATDPDVYRLTVVQFTPATSYSLADLAGTWSAHSILSMGAWMYGTATIDTGGNGTVPDQHHNSGLIDTLISFSLELREPGVYADPTNTTSHSFLSSTKDMLVLTQTISYPNPESHMAIMVK